MKRKPAHVELLVGFAWLSLGIGLIAGAFSYLLVFSSGRVEVVPLLWGAAWALGGAFNWALTLTLVSIASNLIELNEKTRLPRA